MSANILRDAARINNSAIPNNDRAIGEAALQSLREYRRKRYATRHMPTQQKAAA